MASNDYPEEEDLERIKDWDYKDPIGLIKFIETLWYYDDPYFKFNHNEDNGQWELELHTGGWSGNEEIIGALMQSGRPSVGFWYFYWSKSERGGHYYFNNSQYVRSVKNEKQK